MSRSLFILLFICIAVQSNAQKNQKDFDIAEYKHRITFTDHILVFQIQPSGQQPDIIDTHKKYHWYSNNQIKITQGGYSGKLLHGNYSDFYFNNNLKEQGRFNMGLKIGEWKSWTAQGTLAEKINFKEGVLNGDFYRYNGMGVLSESGQYKNGNLHGKLTKYFERDSVSITKYKNGKIEVPSQGPSWLKKLFNKKPKPEITPTK